MNIRKYIAELKRRNVVKEGIAYLIVAWVIVQVAEIVLPTFDVPAFVMKTLLIILGIGFPIWLVLAWIFELTPEGIKKSADVENEKSIAPRTKSKLNKVIIGSLSILVILLIINQFWIKRNEKNTNIEDSTQTTSLIGVLPFSNSKPDPETDYFGFAIADQIIGDLAYLQNITVRPSSSIRKYEKQVIDPKLAADELNVTYILAGNFLMEGNIIRLNIELVEVIANKMIWRDQIEVEFKNAFDLQDIVAKKVAESVDAKFSKQEQNRINKDIPSNSLAYEYYLRGIALPLTIDDNLIAVEILQKSIELDSSFAPAYSELADRLHRVALFGNYNSKKYKEVEEIYLKALSLNKDLISANIGLAMYYAETARIYEAVEISNHLLEINPNNADALFSLGYIYRYAGMVHESISIMEKAILNDPRNPRFRSISLSYYSIGEYNKALKVFESLESSHWVVGMTGYLYFKLGKTDKALEIFNQIISEEPDSFWGLISKTNKAIIQGDTLTGLQTLEKREQIYITDPEPLFYRACDYALLGDKNGCLRNLQKAVSSGYFNYPFMLTNSDLDSVRDDIDFQKILLQAKEKHEAFKKKFLKK